MGSSGKTSSPAAHVLRTLFFMIVAVLALAPGAATAQTVTGTIQGTVADTSGGVLPGATVTIKNTDTGAERVVVSNESGFYSAPYVPLGRYSVTASLASFGTVTRDGIQVGLNETRIVDFKLDPKLTELVTVTGDAPPINATSATVKSSLTSEEIMDKPSLNAGSFLSLAEIFPGFQENPTSGQNNTQSSSGSSINFNNTGTRGSTFQINGVNNDDSSENQHRQGVALSTIQEFTILKNGYSAEFGRGDGAVVLVQTKAGTNTWHGDAYMYRQDSDWNARRFFAAPGSPKPVNQRSQFGFTVGFPLLKNRLFAFTNVDRTESNGENTYTRDLPLPSELNRPRLTRGNDTPQNRAFIQSVLDRFPSGLTPNDPRSARTFTGVARFDFPDEDYSVRGDWNFRPNNSLSARYQWTRQRRLPEDVIAGEQAIQNNRQQNLGATWTHIVGGRLAGEARYGVGVRSTNVVIAGGNDTPIIRFSGLPVSGPIIGNAGSLPIIRDQLDHQFVYNLTWQWFRSHSLRAGTDIRRQQLDDFADNNSRGSWSYTTSCGGTSYANGYLAFLDGCVTSFTKSWGPLFLENRINESNLYVQDEWRLLDSLTLNLGLRYEYVAAPYEAKNRIDYGFSADKNNVEPRLGFAFAPKWEDGILGAISGGPNNIAFQGGYGLYDGRIFQSIFSQNGASVRTNPPNATARTFSTQPGILNHSDPTLGFVFVPGLPAGRATLVLPDPDLEMPQTKKWNMSVERVMPFNSTLKITYQGNHNDKRLKYAIDNLPQSPVFGPVLVVNHPNNAPAAGFPDLRGKTITRVAADVQCAGTGFFPGINVTAACPNPVPLADNEISLRLPRTNERRPNPLYTNNLLISNDAEAWYDGVEFEWTKRLQRGLYFRASYTRSRSLDTTSEATFVGAGDTNQTGPNKRYSKAYSRFHTPHRFTLHGSYRMPFLANRTDWVGQAFGGWQLSGVLVLASGTPFSVTDAARDLDFDGFSEARPVILDRSILGAQVENRDTSQQILRRDAFRSTTFGDTIDDLVPRNAFFSDGLRRVDMALAKVFRMPWKGQSLAARIEGFNVFNWVVFGFPNTDINSATFGAITGNAVSYAPRQVQLTLRYRY
jgi:outer membrane receptor protein involved in Fe transport